MWFTLIVGIEQPAEPAQAAPPADTPLLTVPPVVERACVPPRLRGVYLTRCGVRVKVMGGEVKDGKLMYRCCLSLGAFQCFVSETGEGASPDDDLVQELS